MRYVGVEIIIVDGRYFAYFRGPGLANPPDPGHLIIDNIPLDPEQYRGIVAIYTYIPT